MNGAPKDELLRAVVERYGTAVLRWNRAILRDASLAEDGFQETFLRLARWLKQHDELPSVEKIGGLVLAMAERTAIDIYRRRRRDERPTSPGSPSIEAPGAWLYVEEILGSLAPRERRIVEMSVFLGMSAAEIAEELGLAAGAVRIAKYRAINKIRTSLKADVTAEGGRSDE